MLLGLQLVRLGFWLALSGGWVSSASNGSRGAVMQKIKVMALITMTLISGFIHSSTRDLSPEEKASLDIKQLAKAVEYYHQEFGRYPTNEQGLSLLNREIFVSKDCPCKKVKLLNGLPEDPWGRDYLYLMPGENNSEGFDIWTNGADGLSGGTGINRGCGNWDDLQCELTEQNDTLEAVFLLLTIGIGVGLPPYIAGVYLSYRKGNSINSSLFGYHLGVLFYLVFVLLLSVILPSAL